MKRISIIFLSGILALCLLAGCSSQNQKSSANIEPAGNSASIKTAQTKTSGEAVNINDVAAPVSNDLKNTNDDAGIPDNSSTKTTGVSNGNSSAKATDTSSDSQAPASDVSQDANVQNNNSGTVGGCISNQVKDNTAVPIVNYELDFDKDGTISSEDYKLSGMSHDVFASKLVSNGNVGTSSEAEQVIKGDITVMCGVFSGTCN